LSENFVETGHFQRNFDKVFRQRSTTTLGVSLLGQALVSVLPASCRNGDAMRDGMICRQDAGSTLFKPPVSPSKSLHSRKRWRAGETVDATLALGASPHFTLQITVPARAPFESKAVYFFAAS
jgi:hypothetical protein